MIYAIQYRRKDSCLADALRPDPNWGKRRFTIDTEKLGSDNVQEIEQAARDTAPDGYVFCSMKPVTHSRPQQETPMQSKKWCTYCKKDNHSDDECWSKRAINCTAHPLAGSLKRSVRAEGVSGAPSASGEAERHAARRAEQELQGAVDIMRGASVACPDAQRMGEHACAKLAQCGEPCGDLGKSDTHARAATASEMPAFDRPYVALDLIAASVRAEAESGPTAGVESAADMPAFERPYVALKHVAAAVRAERAAGDAAPAGEFRARHWESDRRDMDAPAACHPNEAGLVQQSDNLEGGGK